MTEKGIIRKATAVFNAGIRTLVPAAINAACPGLGNLFALAIGYDDALAAQNIEKLLKELSFRVDNFENRMEQIENKSTAAHIRNLILTASQETNEEKIVFYAGLIAEGILQTPYDWDKDLQNQFVKTIIELSKPELFLLKVLHSRKPNESLALSQMGRTWLHPNLIISKSTLAWIDLLIYKGLVEDTSVEAVRTGYTPTAHSIKSRSEVRLTTYARGMIDYMIEVQKIKVERSTPET